MIEDTQLKAESELMGKQEKRLRVTEREKNRKKSKSKRVLLRQKVWLKYNKQCAYCGKILEYKDMQVDHMTPKYFYDMYKYPKITLEELNSFKNLMPSCRRCNHYKREEDLEGFRLLIKTLHERISNQYISKVAIDYGIVEIKPFDGIFYFEKGVK